MRRRALRHGDAGPAGRLRADLGHRAELFWPKATQRVREQVPGFCFMAEVYWDLEWTLQQQGFDYAYDKRLYDRLREGHARPVREHFQAGLDYQNKLARFPGKPRRAAGGGDVPAGKSTRRRRSSRFCRRACGSSIRGNSRDDESASRRISSARRDEPVDRSAAAVLRAAAGGAPPAGRSRRPVATARMRAGLGRQLDVKLLHRLSWHSPDGRRLLVAVNYAANQSQCYARLPFSDLAGRTVRLQDLKSPAELRARWQRPGVAGPLSGPARAWGYHAFDVTIPG